MQSVNAFEFLSSVVYPIKRPKLAWGLDAGSEPTKLLAVTSAL